MNHIKAIYKGKRLSRTGYLIGHIGLLLVCAAIAISLVIGGRDSVLDDNATGTLSAVVNISMALMGIAALWMIVNRLHDINHSGWWSLLYFIPVLGWGFWAILILPSGTPGPNKYGPPVYDRTPVEEEAIQFDEEEQAAMVIAVEIPS